MTTKTSIAEPQTGAAAAAPAHGAPDFADIVRLANRFFNEIPGLDGFGRGASAYGLDSAASGLRQGASTPAVAPAPASFAGAGFSPTGVDPQSAHLHSVPAAEHAPLAAPGAAIPVAGVSSVGPGDLEIAPALARPAADFGDFDTAPADMSLVPKLDLDFRRIPSADLYILGDPAAFAREPAYAPVYAAPAQDAAPRRETLGLRPVHTPPPIDVHAIRREFPILSERVNGRPLIWLDNGATTQKPNAVIDRISHFYRRENSNVHRAAHTLAARATDAYENARKIVARFLGAAEAEEIVFVRGATEAINLVAGAWGRQNVGPGDEIVVSHLEHHANIVPWQQLAAEKSAKLKVIPVDDSGQIIFEAYERLLTDRTRIVAVTHVSNALGTVVPIKPVIDRAHAAGARVLIDGAQSVAHEPVNVLTLDADFFVFSGHKIFAPTGVGALYGKRELLDAMPPYQTGGNMIADVTFEKSVFQKAPARFEAGTGNLADAVGLGAALEFVERIGIAGISAYEHALHAYAVAQLKTVSGLKLFGSAEHRASVLSFLLDGRPPEEVGRALDGYGIAVRAGHHCAQPILRRFGVEGTVRASIALYNTYEDIDDLVSALHDIGTRR